MLRKKLAYLAGGALAAVTLLSLMGPAGGGFPSRPRFQAVGVNVAAPATGQLSTSGNVTVGNDLTVSGGDINGIAVTDWTRLSQLNVFTGNVSGITAPIKISNASAPGIIYDDNDAAANNRYWANYAALEDLFFDAVSDVGAGTTWMRVQRTGATVDAINLTATTIAGNGTMDWNGAVDIGDGTNVILLRAPGTGVGVRGTSTGSANQSFVSFQNSVGSEIGFVGDNSGADGAMQLFNGNSGGVINLATTGGGAILANAATIWTASNDGAGSGLDADTLDTLSSSAFAQLAAGGNFTVAPTISSNEIVTRTLFGTYTATATGCTTSPTVIVNYEVHGDLVNLFIPSITCTSNSAGFTLTGEPAALRPDIATIALAYVVNNGTSVLGCMTMNPAGTLSFSVAGDCTSFVTSGSKGLLKNTGFTYQLDAI